MTDQRLAKALLFATMLCAAQGAHAATAHFSKVPADSPVYLGTTVDSPWIRDLGLSGQDALKSALEEFSGLGVAATDAAAAEKFLQAVADALLGNAPGQRMLIEQPGRLQVYLQGLNPVLRVSLSSGPAFERALQSAAEEVGADFSPVDVGGQRVWRASAGTESWFVAVDGDDLVVAADIAQSGEKAVGEIISGGTGFDPDTRLNPAMSDYKLSGSLVSWLDFEQLQMNAVNPDHALYQKLATTLEDKEKWQTFLSPACQGDVSRFVKNTPHVVGAVDHSEAGDKRTLHSVLIWPQADVAAQKAWQGLQGVVLDTESSDSPLQLGFGFSGAGVPGFVQYVAADFAAMQCPLWRDEAANAGLGLAMASSMSAMFSSVKGLTAQVFDLSLDQQSNPDPASLDAQLTVLTDSPSLLLLMLRSVLSLPASIPEDGTPVTVSTPLGIDVQLAVYPHSINVYRGPLAAESVADLSTGPKTVVRLFDYAVEALQLARLFVGDRDGKTPEQLLQQEGMQGLMPVFVEGALQHFSYGMKLQSRAVYTVVPPTQSRKQITAAAQLSQ